MKSAAAKLFLIVPLLVLLGSGCSRSTQEPIDLVLKCNQLFELKKDKYFGDSLQNYQVIWSASRNTCLAKNISLDPYTEHYYAMVIDMLNNEKTVLYYSTDNNELTDENAELDGQTRSMTSVELEKELKQLGLSYF